jgi:hypothetical protein
LGPAAKSANMAWRAAGRSEKGSLAETLSPPEFRSVQPWSKKKKKSISLLSPKTSKNRKYLR